MTAPRRSRPHKPNYYAYRAWERWTRHGFTKLVTDLDGVAEIECAKCGDFSVGAMYRSIGPPPPGIGARSNYCKKLWKPPGEYQCGACWSNFTMRAASSATKNYLRQQWREYADLVLRRCEQCGQGVPTKKRSIARYCSPACARKDRRSRPDYVRHVSPKRRAMQTANRVRRRIRRRFSDLSKHQARLRRCAARKSGAAQAESRRLTRERDRRKKAHRRAASKLHPNIVHLLLVAQKHRCANPYCRKRLNDESATLDHIRPVARGGRNDHANLQVLCKPCNSAKRDKMPADWLDREYAAYQSRSVLDGEKTGTEPALALDA